MQTVKILSSKDESDDQTAAVTCKMLSCDTVSQAKAKAVDVLYINTPFSLRPALNKIDLSEFSFCFLPVYYFKAETLQYH